jgi:hypothetical protein
MKMLSSSCNEAQLLAIINVLQAKGSRPGPPRLPMATFVVILKFTAADTIHVRTPMRASCTASVCVHCLAVVQNVT